jgi:hypothetical protein
VVFLVSESAFVPEDSRKAMAYWRTEEIDCWKTEEICLMLVKNCCFTLWKSYGIVVRWNDWLETRQSWKHIVHEKFGFEMSGRRSPQSLVALPMPVSMLCLLWVLPIDYPMNLQFLKIFEGDAKLSHSSEF